MTQIWCIVEVQDLDKKLDEAEKNSAFEDVHKLAAIGQYVNEKIKSFVTSKGGALLMQRPEANIFNVDDSTLEELEYIIYGYQKSLNVNLPFGMGLELSQAKKAVKKSSITHHPEFYHKDDIYYHEETDRDLENIPSKVSRKVEEPVLAPGLVESEKARQDYINAMAQATVDATTPPPMPQPEQQMQQPGQQMQQPGQEPLQESAPEENVQQVIGSIPDLKPVNPPMSNGNPQEAGGNPPELAQPDDTQEPSYERLINLIATIKMHLPEIMKLQTSNPEAFNASMKFINSAIKLTKHVREYGIDDLKKGKIPMPKFKKKFVTLPTGTLKDQKMKVRDAKTGRDKWVSLKSGQVMNEAGEPVSVKEHNKEAISGKEE